ncbi:hypothetical protein BVW01_22550 [Mycobacterium tuberculosis]|nr:hypothetical protein BVW01_22550 [Mycobacterium tuberculosis]
MQVLRTPEVMWSIRSSTPPRSGSRPIRDVDEAPPATRQRRRCGAPACARQIGAILTSQVITWFDSCRATVPAPQWMHTR